MTASNPSSSAKPVIGVTQGDAAGIGPEVAAAALASGKLNPAFDYALIGQPLDGVVPGRSSPEVARAAWRDLEAVATGALAGRFAAVVTGPVCKATMYGAGFKFPGQTEFFADRCGVRDFAMLLTGGALTVALLTTHLPLSEAIGQVSQREIVRVGKLLANFLVGRHDRPVKIAVAGLNPHAGEGGSLGTEESRVIEPAVGELHVWGQGHAADFGGPVSPDAVFPQALAGRWDGVLCMYHDQGLIPLKLHAFDIGVNVTIGLPIIRTSPDHGTAFDLAGQNRANPGSMIAALNLAAELAEKSVIARSL